MLQLLETLIFQENNQKVYYKELGRQNSETDRVESADHKNITLFDIHYRTATLGIF